MALNNSPYDMPICKILIRTLTGSFKGALIDPLRSFTGVPTEPLKDPLQATPRFVVSLHWAFQTQGHLFLVLDYCSGGLPSPFWFRN